jgi:hypothetical protein
MDYKFLKNGILHIIPLTVVLCAIFSFFPNSYDYAYHAQENSVLYGNYPPLTDRIISVIDVFTLSRGYSVLYLNLIVILYLPYILISKIMSNQFAGFIYLYGSGLPLILFFAWTIPQGIIHVLMLFAILFPLLGLPFFAIFGSFIHREWLAAFCLACGFSLFQFVYIKYYKKVKEWILDGQI